MLCPKDRRPGSLSRPRIAALLVLFACGCNLFRASEQPETGDVAMDAGGDSSSVDVRPTDMRGSDDMRDPGDTRDAGDTGTPDMVTCVPESDEAFCLRQGKNCGVVTGVDDCGVDRQAMCGDCVDNDCGAQEENVCGCPCDIDGDCRVPGERDPSNTCLVCDPLVDPAAWSVDEGVACDDGNACSAESVCDAAGACVATDTEGCEALSTDCQVGSCDVALMTCVLDPEPDDTACTDDGLSCTADFCTAGTCTHPLIDGFCLIDGACAADGTANPANPCEICDVATTTTAWTVTPAAPCNDGDGLTCTSGACDAAGACVSSLNAGNCLINNVCRADGAVRSSNPCEHCDSNTSTSDWSDRPAATACNDGDGLSCTSGACNATGTCVPALDASSCVIANTCIGSGELNPANDCMACDPVDSSTAYSDRDDGTVCGAPLSCQRATCAGGACVYETEPGFCVIAGACIADGEINPGLPCQSCDSASSTTDWTFAATGFTCSTAPACECSAAGECLRTNGNPC